jgi:hypothetical protein
MALAGLSLELLLSISDFLPRVDYSCFSVCNRQLYSLLSRRMNLSPLTLDENFSILTRLEKDMPPYFACKHCNVLHWSDVSEKFGPSGFFPGWTSRLPCVQYGKSSGPVWKFPTIHSYRYQYMKEMSSLHLKLAMRRYYYGPGYGISPDCLSHTQVTIHREFSTKNRVTWLFSREAQICTEPLGLYLRLQDILLSSKWRDLIGKPYASIFNPLLLCPHVRNFHRAIIPILRLYDTRETGPFESTEIPVACNVCSTVSHIELREIDSEKAVVITRWLNLGPGLDEEDPIWKAHIGKFWPSIQGLHCGFDPNYSIEAQCPKRRFEETAPRSFKDLYRRNLCHLRDKEYTRTMWYSYEQRVWHSPFREPSTNKIINFWRSFQALWASIQD